MYMYSILHGHCIFITYTFSHVHTHNHVLSHSHILTHTHIPPAVTMSTTERRLLLKQLKLETTQFSFKYGTLQDKRRLADIVHCMLHERSESLSSTTNPNLGKPSQCLLRCAYVFMQKAEPF